MLDIKYIRENVEAVKKAVINKKVEVDIDHLLSLDEKRRQLISEAEIKRAEQNAAGEKIATEHDAKVKTGAIEQMRTVKEALKNLEQELGLLLVEYNSLLNKIPNVPFDDVPVGKDESANVVRQQIGEIPQFDFKPKDHIELGEALDIIDTKTAAEVTGSRFVYLKGDLVLLQYALQHYVMTVLTDRGILKKIISNAGLDLLDTPFIPVIPPLMIKPGTFSRMSRLEPKEERYHIPSDDLYLIGSAEHTLGSMHMDQILRENDLPLRYVALTAAFRREAGSYGQDIRGIIRQHQFDKIEMESFTLPEHSRAEQDFIVAIQAHILQALQIPYRIVDICTGDMGGPDARQIDMECWLPGQQAYRETHTSDLMTDYQSRRLNTRVRRNSGELEFVHMNDATALAMGRILVAIMENYQQADGNIAVPEVLHPYMLGRSVITKN
ncbi:serine--tRNA ligase [Patescibacteria group bacterium]|nr:serine--tRNA ligase [Patescibacteria group bacterium]